jgi:hypothetical protein
MYRRGDFIAELLVLNLNSKSYASFVSHVVSDVKVNLPIHASVFITDYIHELDKLFDVVVVCNGIIVVTSTSLPLSSFCFWLTTTLVPLLSIGNLPSFCCWCWGVFLIFLYAALEGRHFNLFLQAYSRHLQTSPYLRAALYPRHWHPNRRLIISHPVLLCYSLPLRQIAALFRSSRHGDSICIREALFIDFLSSIFGEVLRVARKIRRRGIVHWSHPNTFFTFCFLTVVGDFACVHDNHSLLHLCSFTRYLLNSIDQLQGTIKFITINVVN